MIEIVVATIILGILATVSIPLFNGVQRYAHEAGVDSDLRSSANATIRLHGERIVFSTPELFEDKATVTSGNNVVLFLVPDPDWGEYACVWASRTFAPGDVYSRYYNSRLGVFTDEPCIGENNKVVTGVNPDPTPTEDEHDHGSDPGDPSATPPAEETPAPSTPPDGTGAETGGNPPASTPAPTTPPATPPASGDPTFLDPNLNLSGKFPVCHHPAGKKYLLLMLPYPALVAHGPHHNDVIPPIAGHYAGHRWNSEGIEIFATHCS